MKAEHNIIFFIDDKLGGVSSLNYNLLKRIPVEFTPLVIQIDNIDDTMAKSGIQFPNCTQVRFETDKKEHRIHALKRLRSLVPDREGAMILNYGTEMAMVDHFPVKQTTYQLVHDDYNVDLAKKYGHVVDVFICHNTVIFQRLMELFPQRKNDIFYLPHGIEMPQHFAQPVTATQPLRLLFLGRMTSSKGIFDLPVIDSELRRNGISVVWGCIGSGPNLEAFKKSWHEESRVDYYTPATNAEVMRLIAAYDVFVLPTKFEGSPVSLIETMAVGLVPVISRIPGGITDIVDESIGYTPPADDPAAFAEAIKTLHHHRNLLVDKSMACRKKFKDQFDLNNTAAAYFKLFLQFEQFHHEKKSTKKPIGSRLDQFWIPPFLTHLLRGRFSAGN